MTKDKIIKKLVRAARKAMKHLDYMMPCTPGGDVWDALYSAVKTAEKKA